MFSKPQNTFNSTSIIQAADRTKLNFESKNQLKLETYELRKSIILQNRIVLFYWTGYYSPASIVILDLETLKSTGCKSSADSVIFGEMYDFSICLNQENQIVSYGCWPQNNRDRPRSALEILSLTDSGRK